MKYFFDKFKEIENRLNDTGHILLALDYDGTLSAITATPQEAVLDKRNKNRLKRLGRNPYVTVAILSGRPLSDLEARVDIADIYYAGNNGFECKGPQKEFVSEDAQRREAFIFNLHYVFIGKLKSFRGRFLENKNMALSIHYRNVKEQDVGNMKKQVRRIIKPYVEEGSVELYDDKGVIEIRPAVGVDKGSALKWIMDDIPLSSADILPVYIGDDKSDEAAFKMTRELGGITVFVGPEDSGLFAEYFVRSVCDVEKILTKLSKTLSSG